jgi:hypothetical protein
MRTLAERLRRLLFRQIAYSRWAEFFQCMFVLPFVVFWLRFFPPPGFAIGLLAGAGALMAIRAVNVERFTVTERVIWIVLTGALCFIEFRAITADRNAHDEQDAAIRWQEEFKLRQERRQFASLLRQGQTVITQQQDLFSRTIGQMTGGDSFCYMWIVTLAGKRVPMFYEVGNYGLYDVHARLVDAESIPRGGDATTILNTMISSEIAIGVGSLGSSTVFTKMDQPLTLEEKDYDFSVFFTARNGFWDEDLRLRRLKDHWAQAIRVHREETKDKKLVFRLVKERVDRDYPRLPNGTVDWRSITQRASPH